MYNCAFRDGSIEGVKRIKNLPMVSEPLIYGNGIFFDCLKSIENYGQYLRSLDVPPPFVVFISLVGIRNIEFAYGIPGETGFYTKGGLPLQHFILPEVYIEADTSDVPGLMRFCFDTLWNAYGLPSCELYSPDGKLIS
jgi:hypothetical protein